MIFGKIFYTYSGHLSDKTLYTYNANDHLLTEDSGLGTTDYVYDDNGNTLTKTSSTENVAYTCDYNNRMISMNDGFDVADVAYDAEGMRVQKTVNGNVMHFFA